jgi:hypothetical protein
MFGWHKYHPDFTDFIRDRFASTSGGNEFEKLLRTMQGHAFFFKFYVPVLCMEFNSKNWPHMTFHPLSISRIGLILGEYLEFGHIVITP